MHPLKQTRLEMLMSLCTGDPRIIIGLIDGPVDFSHPALQGSKIRTIKDSQLAACKSASNVACSHGTFIAGILSSKRGLAAPAICPDCEVILNPIFQHEIRDDRTNNASSVLSTTSEELSNAIIDTIDAGAHIINLSLGFSTSALVVYDRLQQAYDYALKKGVIIVVAAGNQGNIGNTSIISHQWLIPVSACDENGRLDPMSNFGPSIASRGLMAPGLNIKSTYPGGQYTYMSGTSFAAPFVTGALALLWSLFTNYDAAVIKHSIISAASSSKHRSVIPPLLNAETAWNLLKDGDPSVQSSFGFIIFRNIIY
jgi:subtilisin family serine protease